MDVKIGAGRRITIPAELFKETQFKEGDILDLRYEKGDFILSPKYFLIENEETIKKLNKSNEIQEDKSVTLNENKSSISNTFTRKIVSNLEEGRKFSRQVLSECGLVIRTKQSYLNQFCNTCQGQLAKEYGIKDHPCRFISEEKSEIDISKDISEIKSKLDNEHVINNNTDKIKSIDNINKNIEILHKKLDSKIEHINKSSEYINKKDNKELQEIGNKILKPIKHTSFRLCEACGQLYDSGFLIDDIFYCKQCALADFQDYLEKRKESE